MHDGFDPGVDDFPNDSGDGDRPLPTSAQPVTLTLGPVTVELHTIEPGLLEYLAEFYPMHEGRVASPAWIVDARLGDGPGMARNPWDVRYRVDADRHHLTLRAERLENLAITTRKCVREVMVAFCEQRHYVMLHASAVVGERGVVVVAGDKGSGKTTLALRAALLHGYQYLSNDHLIVYAGSPDAGLVLTSLPTLIPVKVGTYFDLEDLLPPPWDTEGLPSSGSGRCPLSSATATIADSYTPTGASATTTRSWFDLGDPANGPDVTVVLASYARQGEDVVPPRPAATPVDALMRQVRSDWMFDPTLNQRYLASQQRDRDAYEADAARLVDVLAERARVVEWAHRGDPAPLFAALRTRRSR